MRKYILMVVFIAANFQVYSQQNTPTAIPENYAQKSKTQKTVAWVLLGGGAVTTITGLAIGSKHIWEDLGRERVRGEGLFYTGIAMVGASIPFFILSKKNARKASLSMSTDRVPTISNGSMVNHQIPAIKLNINLP